MIVLLSGEIATGKSSVAQALVDDHGFHRIRTGSYLAEAAKDRGLSSDRPGLQKMGDILDKETDGDWIVQLARQQISGIRNQNNWVLDSVRRDFQVSRFRSFFGPRIIHIHLQADEKTLEDRFASRSLHDHRDSRIAYEQAKTSETEKHARTLGEIADACFDTSSSNAREISNFINKSSLERQDDEDNPN